MAKIKMPYGQEELDLEIDDAGLMAVVTANELPLEPLSPEQTVKEALANPINSPPLGEIVKPGEKICIIVPDVTRLWQSTFVSAPIVVNELNKAGIPDSDIAFLSACGTHREQSGAEHRQLIGEDLAARIKIFDHKCEDYDNLIPKGVTRRGTEVAFNRIAVEADKIISICGVVYHFLAGFGGGPKMLFPGVAAGSSIQHSHKFALNPGFGNGSNPEVRCGNISASNPFHDDMLEAASMLPPDFALNVVVDAHGRIIKAFAGNWLASHLQACELVEKMNGVAVPGQAHLVIASASGAPKDINLYQGFKSVNNAMHAAKPGGTIILLAQCPEGFGNRDFGRQMCDFDNMQDREKAIREHFSIDSYIGYLCADCAEKYNLIIVSDMEPASFARTSIHAVKTLAEALALAERFGTADKSVIVMPNAGATLPIPESECKRSESPMGK